MNVLQNLCSSLPFILELCKKIKTYPSSILLSFNIASLTFIQKQKFVLIYFMSILRNSFWMLIKLYLIEFSPVKPKSPMPPILLFCLW